MLRLHSVLKQKGISREEFIQYLEISERVYYTRMNGETDFTYSQYQKIRKFLPDMNPDYLLSDEGAETDADLFSEEEKGENVRLRLHGVLKRRGISPKTLIRYLGISEKAYYDRINGETEFLYKEYQAIREFLPDMNPDYLLSGENG